MKSIVKVLTWEGEFVTNAFIEGIEHIEGEFGRFTSLVLLSLTGKKLYAWQYMLAPFPLLLEYKNGSG
ncbi:MAG: hypothetical protein ACXACW_15690 [Candidatus Hodarchaeales archaeon]|jgi:hypothetical protein